MTEINQAPGGASRPNPAEAAPTSGRCAGRRASALALLAALHRAEPAFTVGGLSLLAFMLPTGLAAVVDTRTWFGVDIWLKPLKFQFALAVYLLTLAVYARWLPRRFAATPAYRGFSGIVVVVVSAEATWISLAAAYGTASHFNDSTAVLAGLYHIMLGLAVLLTLATAVFAAAIHFNRELPPAGRAGLVLGLGLVLPLTLVTALTLSANEAHWVGRYDDSAGLPILGWSRVGGDLRVPHFFAVHAMHFVPAFALLSMRLFGPGRRWPVVAFAAAYTSFTAFVFVQALGGRPLVPY
jgi:hypothetical protein